MRLPVPASRCLALQIPQAHRAIARRGDQQVLIDERDVSHSVAVTAQYRDPFSAGAVPDADRGVMGSGRYPALTDCNPEYAGRVTFKPEDKPPIGYIP